MNNKSFHVDPASRAGNLIITTNSILTKFVYLFYPLLLALLTFAFAEYGALSIVKAVLVPGISFVLVSIFRYYYNAPRPYERPDAPPPLIKKDTCGKSFPSRHVFSVFIISMTYLWASFEGVLLLNLTGLAYATRILGAIIFLIGIALSIVRVVGGVHYVRDVLAGALIAIICGFIGFILIP